MFNYFLSIFKKKYPTGVAVDTRAQADKDLDYLHEEIAGDAVPVYKSGMTGLNQYPDENQNQTQSCVAHASTIAYTKGDPRLSKMFFYRFRSNYPQAGMALQDAGSIAKNIGSCLYQTLPNMQTEEQANQIGVSTAETTEASMHKVKNYVQIQNPTIDAITSVINQGNPVAILIYSSYREWATQFPQLLDNVSFTTAPVRHCICVVDAFTLNGRKYLKIQDSAWFGGMSIRYISEEFLAARCYGAIYFIKLDPATSPKPTYHFGYDLKQGDNNEEVEYLQKRLMYEGTFPAVQAPTGFFGGITLKAVKDYQTKHNIPSTGFVGPITRARLNNS